MFKLGRIAVSLGATALLVGASAAQAVPLTPFETIFNTDFAYGGSGVVAGTATININAPDNIDKAYLFWHQSTPSVTADGSNVIVNGTAVTGVNIGVGGDNARSTPNNAAWRADVTGQVSDGTNTISGLSRNFTALPSGNITGRGAGLAVFGNDGNDANNRDVAIFNGNDSNWLDLDDAAGLNISLNNLLYDPTNVDVANQWGKLTLFISDVDLPPPFQWNFTVNDDPIDAADLTITADGTFRIVELDILQFLTPNVLSSLNIGFTYPGENGGEAFSTIAAFINLPHGVITTPDPPLPEPSTLPLIGAALAGFWMARRRRSAK